MINVMNPEQIHETIPVDKLLFEVMKKKEAGLRLSQICVAYVNEKYELSYTFADDDTYQYSILRVVIEVFEQVPSICKIYPYAVFYENEMAELFDVNIEMIDVNYHGKFYRIEKEAPMLPPGALEKKEKAEEDEKKRIEEEKKAAIEAARKAEEEAKAKALAAKAAASNAPANNNEGGQK